MARRRKKLEQRSFFDDVSPQTKQAIGAVLFAVLGIFFVLSSFGYAGIAGTHTERALEFMFGYGSFVAPIICALYVYVLMRPREDEQVSLSKAFGVALLFISLLGALSLIDFPAGGLAGKGIAWPLTWLLGTATAGVVLGALALVSIFLTFNIGLAFPTFFKKKEQDTDEEVEIMTPHELPTEPYTKEEIDEPEDVFEQKSFTERLGLKKGADTLSLGYMGPYNPPPLSLLRKDRGKAQVGDVKANANIIKRALKNFNIDVEMDEVSIGPSVTRYALKPAEGVRISKIVGLQNNLELALAASPVRIEAPIPGKSLVGIEVPNVSKTTIGLASLLSAAEYSDSPKPLLVALGRDITGKAHFANIAKMPHGLIAGTTGSGKSATIHAFITSLLYRNPPEQLRFIMIDPKRVELTLYNGIPHLLTPVVTDPKKAIMSLKWAIKEMERRYDILQSEKVRDITSYHENVYKPQKDKWMKAGKPEGEKDELPEPMPYIVIIIDELADLMQSYPRELEASIVRLAQMSRAVGIHLILSTQRPSVNVITGLIKANVPSRIALQMASQVDSRTILDQVGAEKLLGAGDMLFLSGELSKPQRLQSAYVSEDEVKSVVDYLKDQTELHELDSIDLSGEGGKSADVFFDSGSLDGDEDDLYEDAKQAVLEAGKASTSYIQRKLRVGYSRAARLVDMLEERGVIGPADGAKPREVRGGGSGNPNEENES